MKITALATCCVDIYPELNEVYVGGNSVNFATQCVLTGANNVSIIGGIGNDEHGSSIENHLDKMKINRDLLHKMNEPTACNKIFINENGDRYFKEDSWNGGAFEAFRLTEEDWVQLNSSDIISMPAGDPNFQNLLSNRGDQLIAIDFLDYHSVDQIAKVIDQIDITFLSAKKEMLLDLENLSITTGKLVVATLGPRGSQAFYNGEVYKQKAVPVKNIVDTTGCGDAFQAAFTLSYFQNPDISLALKEGAIAAKRVLSFVGGVD